MMDIDMVDVVNMDIVDMVGIGMGMVDMDMMVDMDIPVSHIQVVDLSIPFWSSFSLDILFKVVIGAILLLITLPFWIYQIYLCIAGEII